MATNIPTVMAQFFLDDGSVAANCLLDTFASGTTTPQATWTNAAGDALNSNPIELDAAGRCIIFVDPTLLYTFRLRSPEPDPATVWTRDSIAGLPVTNAEQFVPLAGGVAMTGRFTLSGNATENLNPVPLQQVNSLIATSAASLTTTLADQVPIGTVVMWLTGSPPTGWLVLNGTAASRTTYADLFDLWGTSFGPGDGTTTFDIPDMRGRFPRGLDLTGTVDPGGASRELGDVQEDAMQNLTGSFGTDDRALNFSPTGVFGAPGGTPDSGSSGSGSGAIINFDASRQARTATETRPKNVAFYFIVKAS